MRARIEIFQAIIAAWKAKDIDAVLAHMADDIVWHFAAGVAPPVTSKRGARKFLERFGGEIQEITWRVFDSAESADRLFVEGVDEYVTTDGIRVVAPYAGVLEFRGDLVTGWRDYVDIGTVDAQKAGAPVSAHIEALIARPALPSAVHA
jgi:limonene-1,2-epoxide hydrolase